MTAIDEFRAALQKQRAVDPRKILCAKVPIGFYYQLITDAEKRVIFPNTEQNPHLEILFRLFGIPIYIGIDEKVIFEYAKYRVT